MPYEFSRHLRRSQTSPVRCSAYGNWNPLAVKPVTFPHQIRMKTLLLRSYYIMILVGSGFEYRVHDFKLLDILRYPKVISYHWPQNSQVFHIKKLKNTWHDWDNPGLWRWKTWRPRSRHSRPLPGLAGPSRATKVTTNVVANHNKHHKSQLNHQMIWEWFFPLHQLFMVTLGMV